MTDQAKSFAILDSMADDVETYALECVRARGRPDELDPQGAMTYEAMGALVLFAAAMTLRSRSGASRQYVTELFKDLFSVMGPT